MGKINIVVWIPHNLSNQQRRVKSENLDKQFMQMSVVNNWNEYNSRIIVLKSILLTIQLTEREVNSREIDLCQYYTTTIKRYFEQS